MILLVDDKKENIFSLKSLLEIHKFKVDTVLSGEEALKKILKNTYSLIILDVQMPGMDGFEVAEARDVLRRLAGNRQFDHRAQAFRQLLAGELHALLPELGKAKSGVIMGWIGIGISVLFTAGFMALGFASAAFNH